MNTETPTKPSAKPKEPVRQQQVVKVPELKPKLPITAELAKTFTDQEWLTDWIYLGTISKSWTLEAENSLTSRFTD